MNATLFDPVEDSIRFLNRFVEIPSLLAEYDAEMHGLPAESREQYESYLYAKAYFNERFDGHELVTFFGNEVIQAAKRKPHTNDLGYIQRASHETIVFKIDSVTEAKAHALESIGATPNAGAKWKQTLDEGLLDAFEIETDQGKITLMYVYLKERDYV